MAKGQQKGNREFKETEEGKGQDNRRGVKSKGWRDSVAANTWIGKEEVETDTTFPPSLTCRARDSDVVPDP